MARGAAAARSLRSDRRTVSGRWRLPGARRGWPNEQVRGKVLSRRGGSWLLANCSVTTVRENVSEVMVISELDSALRTVRPASGPLRGARCPSQPRSEESTPSVQAREQLPGRDSEHGCDGRQRSELSAQRLPRAGYQAVHPAGSGGVPPIIASMRRPPLCRNRAVRAAGDAQQRDVEHRGVVPADALVADVCVPRPAGHKPERGENQLDGIAGTDHAV